MVALKTLLDALIDVLEEKGMMTSEDGKRKLKQESKLRLKLHEILERLNLNGRTKALPRYC